MPRASTGFSIKAGNLLRYLARGYQPDEEMSIADRGPTISFVVYRRRDWPLIKVTKAANLTND
jgi:hypothetical protein